MAFLVERISARKDPCVHPFQKGPLRSSLFRFTKNQHLDPNIRNFGFYYRGFTTKTPSICVCTTRASHNWAQTYHPPFVHRNSEESISISIVYIYIYIHIFIYIYIYSCIHTYTYPPQWPIIIGLRHTTIHFYFEILHNPYQFPSCVYIYIYIQIFYKYTYTYIHPQQSPLMIGLRHSTLHGYIEIPKIPH